MSVVRPRLRAPLRPLLSRPVDDVSTQRMWSAIRRSRSPEASRQRRTRALVAFAAAAVLLFAVLLVLRVRAPAGPLALDVDRVVLEVHAADAPRKLEASDGSSITAEPDTRIEVIENTSEAFATGLSRGRARYDVVPGGPRRWTVDCGAFVVEVVGTAFVVERDGTRARVTVERGEVVVRGEAVPDRIRRLRAGEELHLDATAQVKSTAGAPGRGELAPPPVAASAAVPAPDDAPLATAPSAAAPPAPPPSATPPPATPSTTPPPATAWRDLARAGDFREAWDSLGEDGFRQAAGSASVDELLALADVARLSGHPAAAVAPLSRILEQHGGDGRASVAALTLGRLYLDALGNPGGAVAYLNRAIAAGLPGGLAEDALARRVEAYARSGSLDAARGALDELERRYPASGRLPAARRWIVPAP